MRPIAELPKDRYRLPHRSSPLARSVLMLAAFLYSLALIVLPCTEALAAAIGHDRVASPSGATAPFAATCTIGEASAQHPGHYPDTLCCGVGTAVTSDDARPLGALCGADAAPAASVATRPALYLPTTSREPMHWVRLAGTPRTPLYLRLLHLLI